MRNFLRELDATLSNALSPVVKWIIYLCVGIYLFLLIGSSLAPATSGFLYHWLGASVSDTILKGRVWQLATYAFVHAGFGHLFFNLLGLYFFGQRLEFRWGSEQFAKFCLIVGAGAVLTHLVVTGLLHLATGSSIGAVIVGISGVVYGVMIACALYYPDDIVYFQFFIPIKLKYLVAIMAILTFISAGGSQGNVAHLTHLGGLLFGYLYVKFPLIFEWIPALKIPLRKKPRYVDPRERWRNHR
jgi:membrane associated rhomboid family serine protease